MTRFGVVQNVNGHTFKQGQGELGATTLCQLGSGTIYPRALGTLGGRRRPTTTNVRGTHLLRRKRGLQHLDRHLFYNFRYFGQGLGQVFFHFHHLYYNFKNFSSGHWGDTLDKLRGDLMDHLGAGLGNVYRNF